MNKLFVILLSFVLLHEAHASASGVGGGAKNARSPKHLAKQTELKRLTKSTGETEIFLSCIMTPRS